MGIKIGTTFSGTVEQIGTQSIQTKFFMIGVPLIPLQSYFVLRESGDGVNGFAIALHGKSVLLAYVRWGSFLAAVLGGVFAMVTPSYRRGPADFAFALVAAAVCAVATLVLGKPSAATLERRKVLLATTGLSAMPSMLPAEVAQMVLSTLHESPSPESPDWRFAVASYQAVLEPGEAALRAEEEAWATCSGGSSVTAEGPSRLIADNLNR